MDQLAREMRTRVKTLGPVRYVRPASTHSYRHMTKSQSHIELMNTTATRPPALPQAQGEVGVTLPRRYHDEPYDRDETGETSATGPVFHLPKLIPPPTSARTNKTTRIMPRVLMGPFCYLIECYRKSIRMLCLPVLNRSHSDGISPVESSRKTTTANPLRLCSLLVPTRSVSSP